MIEMRVRNQDRVDPAGEMRHSFTNSRRIGVNRPAKTCTRHADSRKIGIYSRANGRRSQFGSRLSRDK